MSAPTAARAGDGSPRPLRWPQSVIHELDPTVNAAGVEAFMRLHHGTLNHLSRAEFAAEIALAKACEREEPGHLRMCAGCDGSPGDYDNAEHFVRQGDER